MASSSRKRREPVRFRLTLAGWLFLVVCIVLGVAAVKSHVALMFVLCGGMMGALHVSAVMARRIVRAVDVTRDIPSRAWQYQTVPLGYHLRNRRRRGSCLSLHVVEQAVEGIDNVAGYCVHLPAGAVFRAGARIAVRRRGRVALSAIQISTGFPFGLVTASRRIRIPASLVIWPARGRLKGRLLHRGAVESSSAAPSRATGGQDEFFGLREYRPGDNPRWIHWRRSATKRTPVVREMSRPLPEVLWVIVDTWWSDLSELGQQQRERLLRFAATLIDHAFARDYQVGLALAYANRVVTHRPAAGRGQRRALLDALADADANTTTRLAQTLSALHRDQLGQAQAVVVTARSDQVDQGPLLEVRSACRHLTVLAEPQLARVFQDYTPADSEQA